MQTSLWQGYSSPFLRHALKGDFKLVLSSQVIREARERIAKGTAAQRQALERFLADCDSLYRYTRSGF
jgi:hypothetical protein